MNTNIYAVATPVLLVFLLLEILYCIYRKNGYYKFSDTITNMATAIGNQTVNVFVAWILFLGFGWVFETFAPVRLGGEVWHFVALFFIVDFFFYWFHRAGHTFNIMWAAHSPHHSSEELNYSVAYRSSVTQRVARFLFFVPVAAMGFPPEILLPMAVFNHLLQFWPHTCAIKRLPLWFEAVINCPMHHRIHHAINNQYLDKNYGGVLIIWDRMFGTYVVEEEPVVLGMRPGLKSWDPLAANLFYWKILFTEAMAAPTLRDGLRHLFRHPSWQPAWIPKAAGPKWTPETHVKYQKDVPTRIKFYLVTQLLPALGMMLMVSRYDSPLTVGSKVLVGLLVWVSVYSWGNFLEERPWASRFEWARLALTAVFLSPIISPGAPLAPVSLALWSGSLAFAVFLAWCVRSSPVARYSGDVVAAV